MVDMETKHISHPEAALSTEETQIPAPVELHYSAATVAARIAFLSLLAVAASVLLAGTVLQAPLLLMANRFGEPPLLLGWLVCLALFALGVWWRLRSFVLRADTEGIYRADGWGRRFVKWSEVASAVAKKPAVVSGQEYMEMLSVALRDHRGRDLVQLEYSLGGGLPAEQVVMFKRYVKAQLKKNQTPMEGPALAWINWG